jgi:hypothetical protein
MGFPEYLRPLRKNAEIYTADPATPTLPSTTLRFPFGPSTTVHSKIPIIQPSSNADEQSVTASSSPSRKYDTLVPLPLSQAHGEPDSRNSPAQQLVDIKAEIMASRLHQQQRERMWMDCGYDQGVVLKKAKGDYACCPSDLRIHENGLCDAVKKLNVRVLITVALFHRRKADCDSVPFPSALRLSSCF